MAYRGGNFQEAWDSYMAFFRHPQRNELDYMAFVNCFVLEQCPDVGVLGQIIGKPRAEPANLETFCPRLRKDPDDTERMAKAERREMYDRVVANGLRDTCPAWAARQRSQLNESPITDAVVTQALPLTWYEPQDGGFAPAIAILAGDTHLRPRVDTGASSSFFDMAMADDEALLHGDLQLSDVRQRAIGIYDVYFLTVGNLGALRLGRSLHRQVRFDVRDTERKSLHHPFPPISNVGMNVLLRYGTVCFAWDEQRLYLGDPGPCARGTEPYEAWLTGYLSIHVRVPASDGTRFAAVIDTGAHNTNCSQAFLEANGGESMFSIGDSQALASKCLADDSVLFPWPEYGYAQIAIRMNTLLQYQAFGWQLNPLRVLFVPRNTNQATAEVDRGEG